jgi:hypothetical protein
MKTSGSPAKGKAVFSIDLLKWIENPCPGCQPQVEQEPEVQEAQPAESDFTRALPPPIPKLETRFRTSGFPQASQQTSFSPPSATRASNRDPQLPHSNS